MSNSRTRDGAIVLDPETREKLRLRYENGDSLSLSDLEDDVVKENNRYAVYKKSGEKRRVLPLGALSSKKNRLKNKGIIPYYQTQEGIKVSPENVVEIGGQHFIKGTKDRVVRPGTFRQRKYMEAKKAAKDSLEIVPEPSTKKICRDNSPDVKAIDNLPFQPLPKPQEELNGCGTLDDLPMLPVPLTNDNSDDWRNLLDPVGEEEFNFEKDAVPQLPVAREPEASLPVRFTVSQTGLFSPEKNQVVQQADFPPAVSSDHSKTNGTAMKK